MEAKCKAAVEPLGKCSPVFGVAVLRTWCDAWKTASRGGFPIGACVLCGCGAGDLTRHMVRCPVLWREEAHVSAIPAPSSLAEAIALRTSEQFGPRRPSGKQRLPTFALRLALACDIFHKLKCSCDEARPRARAFGDSTIRAAAANAWRRLGAL